MQCEAMTIKGRQCRNHAVEGDVFCDIHRHDWSRKHLKFQAFMFASGLIAVIFTFGLLYESFVLSAFDINYLKYAEFSDMIQSAVRFGGMVLFYLFISLLVFHVALFLYFFSRLIWKILANSQLKRLPVKQRMKIYGVCSYIFCLNFLAYIMLLFPARMAGTSHRILIKREQLIDRHLGSLIDNSDDKQLTGLESGNFDSGYSQDFFQEFLLYASLNNHPFFLVMATVVLLSITVTFTGVQHAIDTRECINNHLPDNNVASPGGLNTKGLSLSYNCDRDDQTTNQTGIFGSIANVFGRYHDFPLITFTALSKDSILLHLASTGRFELFFNSRTKKPLIVPREMLAGLSSNNSGAGNQSASGLSTRTEDKGTSAANNTTNPISKAIGKLNHTLREDLEARRQTDEKYESLHRSVRKLHSALQSLNSSPARTETEEQSGIEKTSSIDRVSPECWTRPIISIFNYATSAAIINDEADIERLERLAETLIDGNSDFILIVGYTDISGANDYNHLLSLRRAEEAAFLLIQAGIDRSAIHVVGRGEMPASTLSARRIEIRDCSRRK